MNKTCIILGAGGHARVLIDCLQTNPTVSMAGILDPDPEKAGAEVYGVPILGNDELLPEIVERGVEYFVVGLGGTGNNLPRKRLFELAVKCGLKPLTVQHPSASVSQRAIIGEGCQLLPGAIVNAGAKLGMNVILNSGAIVEHDCVVGDHVHVATGAKLASTIFVGDGAHIGAGATIRQCIRIGEFSVVGAGAVVVKDVPAHTTVVGVPAEVLRKDLQ
jgi:sugar O-acyltransferase (sialic acid O-acetyltransferase NeuD family)